MTSELKPCPFCQMVKYLKIKNSYCEEFSGYYGFEVICDATGFEGHEKGCGASGSWGETEEIAATTWNTRAVPDVPELVRYDIDSGGMEECKDGDFILYDQAAAIMTGLKAELYDMRDDRDLALKWRDHDKERAEAELAQIKAQEPVGWLHLHPDFTPEFSNTRLTGGDFDRGFREEAVYASPAPAASVVAKNATTETDLKAENERLREALKRLTELNENHSPFGGEIYQDRINRAWELARAALNPSEQQT